MPGLLEVLQVSALVPSHKSTLTEGRRRYAELNVHQLFIVVRMHLANQGCSTNIVIIQ